MILKFFKTHPDAQIPTRANPTDSGMDLTSVDDDFVLNPEERRLVKTGLKMGIEKAPQLELMRAGGALKQTWELQIRPRSGLSLKHGITVLNSPGTIDSDYRGEIGVILINHGKEPFEVKKGSKIAQMIIAKSYIPEIEIVLSESDLGTTSRGEGGFGSTDKK